MQIQKNDIMQNCKKLIKSMHPKKWDTNTIFEILNGYINGVFL